tara:strand:- start:4297 stop:4503 length:207 start_codon:yes stop_codon:yes gene_type:complete
MNNLIAGDIMMTRIKDLETELAELKASLPQIKHDAIIEAADAFFRTEEYTLAVRTEVVGYMRCYAIRQ